MRDPYIAVLPYGHQMGAHLDAMPLDALHWPLGTPERLEGTVADLEPYDHLLVFPKTSIHWKLNWGTRAKVSLMVVEPRLIHARHLAMLRVSYRRFHRVFTHDALTLKRLPNARFLPAASTWVPDYAQIDLTKTAQTALIASARRDTAGHQLRHAVVDAVRTKGLDVDIMGRGYAPFDHKSEGHAPYRFSVVIENIQAGGYFTEKLIDSLLCESVPIYWGAPDVAQYFDDKGIIVCDSLDALVAAVAGADAVKYNAMREPLLQAKKQAIALRDYRILAAQNLQQDA
ncbi:glycosyltransferase family 10 [Ascidiaceihabitans sp.]|uniref:glycosyltransferase family 10 domain-containing protein n=1 Tax=Ascidiaceihabitans sp. TaxID=1872644 RepID=UPI00329774B6